MDKILAYYTKWAILWTGRNTDTTIFLFGTIELFLWTKQKFDFIEQVRALGSHVKHPVKVKENNIPATTNCEYHFFPSTGHWLSKSDTSEQSTFAILFISWPIILKNVICNVNYFRPGALLFTLIQV